MKFRDPFFGDVLDSKKDPTFFGLSIIGIICLSPFVLWLWIISRIGLIIGKIASLIK
jgi:hypothetical protein